MLTQLNMRGRCDDLWLWWNADSWIRVTYNAAVNPTSSVNRCEGDINRQHGSQSQCERAVNNDVVRVFIANETHGQSNNFKKTDST